MLKKSLETKREAELTESSWKGTPKTVAKHMALSLGGPAMDTLKFEPLASLIEVAFWQRASDYKLNSLRLSEDWFPVTGFQSPSRHHDLSSRVVLDHASIVGNTIVTASGPEAASQVRESANCHFPLSQRSAVVTGNWR